MLFHPGFAGAILLAAVLCQASPVETQSTVPKDVQPAPSPAPRGMIWIPAGRTTIGSDHHYSEERQAHVVEVGGFWIDRFEVTNQRFAEFVEATGYATTAERATELGFPAAGSAVFQPPTEGGAGWTFLAGATWRHPEGPGSSIDGRLDEPVVHVSFEDAVAFATWSGRTLPTEEQWEHAARLGLGEPGSPSWQAPETATGKPLANTWQGYFPLENQALDGFPGRAPVGSFPPDELGVFDMIGNVWEWTRSPYCGQHGSTNAGTCEQDGYDPQQPGGSPGVIKGGSYLCAPTACRRYRASARQPQDRRLGTNHLGFRTVVEPTSPTSESRK